MSLEKAGSSISELEIQNISAHGIWLLVRGQEYLISYEKFPWFKEAKVSEILDVSLSTSGNLHWPALDVDLSVEILESPERFPLIAK